MTGCHTNTATAPLSACHEELSKTLPIQADLNWSLFLSSHFALLFFCFPSQVIISCFYFAFFVWTITYRNLALRSIASEHAYRCAHPVIAFSPFQSHLTVVPPDTQTAFFKAAAAALFSSTTLQSTWTQHEAYSSLTAHLMLLCRHHAFQRADCPLPPFLSIFSPALIDVAFITS